MKFNGERIFVPAGATRRELWTALMKPTLTTIANHMAKMTPENARRRWELLVGAAFTQEARPDEFMSCLDFNARLATALRENGAAKLVWGDE